MSLSTFQSFNSRLDRLEVVVECLAAFERCYYERDVARAEKDLAAALAIMDE